MRLLISLVLLGFLGPSARADNMLRNGDFQDDWSILLPELKNHHWNYSTEVYNRRDYNPDVWRLSGKWEWRDADKPRGQRKLVLASPSRVVQSVNWVTVNNSAKLVGWPDAGGFPAAEAVRSKTPLALVRDLTFRLKLSGKDLTKDGAKIVVAWSSSSPIDDPLGEKRVVFASVPVPEGTYAEKTVEVKLPAALWLDAAKKDPAFARDGALIPMAATCEVILADKQAGTIELIEAELTESGPTGPNLLPNGGFEELKEVWPIGWSRPQKYRYFPPGVYYVFNTWHNSNSDNRGPTLAQSLVTHSGKNALQMIVPSGDEVCVVSEPIPLNQTQARLIEVRAWVKTDQLAMLQIDAEDESGKRIDGFNFIHKAMPSVGTDEWRIVRQVFRPASPLKSIRLKLCARGTNGYTLGGTGSQPQQNAVGTIWWDDVQLFEPETPATELTGRGVKGIAPVVVAAGPRLTKLDLGERLWGRGNVVRAELHNPGAAGSFTLKWMFVWTAGDPRLEPASIALSEEGKVTVGAGKTRTIEIPYSLYPGNLAYTECRGRLTLEDAAGKVVATAPMWFSTWFEPIDLQLGSLYLRPEQKQFVRMNLALTHAEMAQLESVKLEVLRRGEGKAVISTLVAASPEAIRKQRARIPDGLRGDLRNLLLVDLDVSGLPIHPFDNPQQDFVIWVTTSTRDKDANKMPAFTLSVPFGRLAHDKPQSPITSVRINESGDFLVNEKPWMPWGVAYGHNPVYDGPADSLKYHDLANLKPWSLYDRHGGNLADRSLWDGNCVRYVEGPLVKQPQLEELWKKGLYASTVFLTPPTANAPWPEDHLKYLRSAPMVASVSRGPEEAFGLFLPMTAAQLDQLKSEVDYLRKATGKPVMVGHGGYWTRVEFERVPFFDVYDPETEPWYPAPIHTDLSPLVAGKGKTIWLRPQMYESVPFERWRYHTYVELIRGARGWQIAHGPGDPSTFRGLHGELRYLQPAIYSKEKSPAVKIEPGMEHLVRTFGGKTTIIAATTHGMSFGNWRWAEKQESPGGRVRVTADPHVFRDESDGYHAGGDPAAQNLTPHGIQYLTDPRSWPAGTKLVTWVKLDERNPPKDLVVLGKADGRWTHAGAFGAFDLAPLRADNAKAFWFLRTFYRHARGFLGWSDKVSPEALPLVPGTVAALGALPKPGEWVKLEIPLEKLGATGKLLDGVGFLHDGGRVWWAGTKLVTPEGTEVVVFGDHEDRPDPAQLKKVKIAVAGLKKGTKVRVLFEGREIVTEEGYFVDDFQGVDLYQRYGGERSGYGNAPVAVHLYEFPTP